MPTTRVVCAYDNLYTYECRAQRVKYDTRVLFIVYSIVERPAGLSRIPSRVRQQIEIDVRRRVYTARSNLSLLIEYIVRTNERVPPAVSFLLLLLLSISTTHPGRGRQ